ncbi:flagellar biosynthesis anti-sigma factor FlgM [Alkalilimnicola ehrlichii MLHE-1]|uniref:Negative regulator of flagellin synthesis n=1 Tax=Alkalilimnicola ehrlichii (strain ATCC BAA-1101 / DSM 17681 / MLHE-1) TaxID=187272 RepID=Q0AA94_ALKEH|nr:flagellar biosynthesis anti-sigma factor FlgM [Alkalilimnicola ehrlichii]ABI56243.1 anti-sigma-28 factor, FlgM [Alkalilimnicola ehrlichii MLHE-1]
MTDPINNGNRLPATPGLTPGNAGKAGGSTRQDGAGERSSAAGERPAADQAAVSDRLQAVRQQIDATPEVNRERVDALKERIANGEYPVDAERIASRMVELENLLND